MQTFASTSQFLPPAWPTFATVDQVAELLGVSRRTIERWIDLGRLKTFQAGRRRCVRIHKDDLERFLESARD